MPKPDALAAATELWLEARRKFMAGGCQELDAFTEATGALFAVFAEDCADMPKSDIGQAFHHYRETAAYEDDLRHGITRKKLPRSVRSIS